MSAPANVRHFVGTDEIAPDAVTLPEIDQSIAPTWTGEHTYDDQSGLTLGEPVSETITETTSPTGFTFGGTYDRDIHRQTAVSLTNSDGAAQHTEDVTVTLYDGADNTGTVVVSETQSVTIAAGGSTTVTFIASAASLDGGTYYLEVTTSGANFTVDQTDETVDSATFSVTQTPDGQYHVETQDGNPVVSVDPLSETTDVHGNELANIGAISGSTGVIGSDEIATDAVGTSEIAADAVQTSEIDLSITPTWTGQHTFAAGADLGGDLVDSAKALTIYDFSAGYINQGALQNSSLTVTAGNGLTGGGSVSLGGSTTVSIASGGVQTDELDLSITPTWTGGHTFGAGATLGGDLTDDVPNVIYDYANNWIPTAILESSTVTVAGNAVSLGGSTAISHADISNIGSADHHSRYADSEAVSAVESSQILLQLENRTSDPSGVGNGTLWYRSDLD